MPIEIRRFGVGHRRPDGPPGTAGVSGQVIHSDGRGSVAELAFGRAARMEPHASPNQTWFVVIEGGGWVGVGAERTRVAAGEAVLWPADVPHAAWTEHSQMRAFTIEFAEGEGNAASLVLEVAAGGLEPGARDPSRRAEGGRAAGASGSIRPDPSAGEPA